MFQLSAQFISLVVLHENDIRNVHENVLELNHEVSELNSDLKYLWRKVDKNGDEINDLKLAGGQKGNKGEAGSKGQTGNEGEKGEECTVLDIEKSNFCFPNITCDY